ncbi:aminotransferase class I/II-fold pyridoxal phosphate-dependent enzyme [Vibrio maritimus]
MTEPSENIYESFNMFMDAAKIRPITELSAGVNWQVTPDCVKRSLMMDIEYDLSYRNYGRSAGGKLITDTIEICEAIEAGFDDRVKCALTGGATEGAHVLFSSLLHSKTIDLSDNVAIVGVSFPVYSSLMNRLGINYKEMADEDKVVPSIDKLISSLESFEPSIVIIALPHNPSGLLMDCNYYESILSWSEQRDIKVIVDRVCMMPWDRIKDLNRLIFKYVSRDVCFVIDSPSKSVSLAGLRIGYVLMADKYFDDFEKEQRCRSLNPIVFGTLTLALCRLGDLAFSSGNGSVEKIVRFLRIHINKAYSQYPSDFLRPKLDVNDYLNGFISDYKKEIHILSKRVRENYNAVVEIFGEDSIGELVFDAGFNVLLKTKTMTKRSEVKDQYLLANNYGSCVLTQRCFHKSESSDFYFVRLSLTIPSDSFRNSLSNMYEYYHNKGLSNSEKVSF